MIIEICVVLLSAKLYKKGKQNSAAASEKRADKSKSKTGPKSQGKNPVPASSYHIKKKPLSLKTIDRNIKIASVSLVLAAVGLISPILSLLSIPGMIYVSAPIHQRTLDQAKEGRVTVDTLVSIIFLGCVVKGFYVMGNFAVLAFTFSQKLLNRVTQDSRGKLVDIYKQLPNQVWVLTNGVEINIPIHEVKTGDTIVINAGETIAVDGVIVKGIAGIDQHILTGEGMPVEKSEGDEVFASTVVLSGRIQVQVKHAGQETNIAKIGDILNKSIEFKSTVELRAQTMADKTVLPTLIMSGISFPFLGVEGALAVINSHFKHKMAVISPVSIINYLNIASKHGLVIKDGRSLDLLNKIDTIVFDKTGTLTEDVPSVGTIHVCAQYTEKEILRYTAAAESRQSHPIAKALLKAALEKKLDLPDIDEAGYQVGYGLTVTVEEQLVQVGSDRFIRMLGIPIPENFELIRKSSFMKGHSLVLAAIDNELVGAIELIPTVRPEARQVIQDLTARPNIKETYIISGDSEAPTRILANQLGIPNYFAETLPENKAQIIRRLRDEGKFICYIGDGINDAIALKQSHVSISLRGASTVAMDTAQIILMDQGLTQVNFLFDLSEEFQQNMNAIFTSQVTPSIISIGGVLFFGFGLGFTIAMNMVGLGAGTYNAMKPLIKEKKKREEE